MAKEMIISSSAHEKKIAIIEDGVVTEYFVEREDESQGLAGSLYKGRVMKVLPGMQSAFVDIGLDRDAFLYVSDFLEEEGFDDLDSLEDAKEPKEIFTKSNYVVEPTPQPVAQPVAVAKAVVPFVEDVEDEEEIEEEEMSIIPLEDNTAIEAIRDESRENEEDSLADESRTDDIPVETTSENKLEIDDIDESAPEADLSLDNTFDGTQDLEEVAELPEPEQVAEPLAPQVLEPQVIIPPPSHDFIRISDEPEEVVEAIVDTSVAAKAAESTETTQPEAVEAIEVAPTSTNEVAEVTQETSQGQEISEPKLEAVSDATVEEASSESKAVEVAEVVEEEPSTTKRRRGAAVRKEPAKKKAPARRRGKKAAEEPVEEVEAASTSLQYERIVDDENPDIGELLKDAIIQHKIVEQLRKEEESPVLPVEKIIEPEVLVGSLQSKIQANHSFQRIVDEEEKAQAQATQTTEPEENNAALASDSEPSSVKETTTETDNELSDDLARDGGERDDRDWQSQNKTGAKSSDRSHFSQRRGSRRRRRGGPPQQPRPPANNASGEPAPVVEKLEPFPREPREPRETRETREPRENQSSGRYHPPAINELLREGQEILVQIAKEPIALKGARITSHIALPGRYLVYMPTVHHIGVSRKIASDAERLRLKRTMLALRDREKPPGGFIVRTACEGHTEEELHDDMMYLVRTWQDIRKKSEKLKAPAIVASELDLIQRTLRDQLTDDIVAIRVDNEEEYTKVVDFVSRFQPKLVKRVKLYTWKKPIFEEYGVQEEIDKALKPRVWLPSGGYIVINQTEALVAIDVNTGKYVGRSNRLEDTITKINMEAAKEIVRQIRLRDLGGIIVLDLIDMEERRNRIKVMQVLEQELKTDRSPSKVLQFNDFGLVAITRKRVRQSLERTLCSPCPNCEGSGLVKSPQTICYEILAEARRFASETDLQPASEVILRVNPEVATALRGTEKKVLNEIEAYLGCSVTLRGDINVHQERYDFAML